MSWVLLGHVLILISDAPFAVQVPTKIVDKFGYGFDLCTEYTIRHIPTVIGQCTLNMAFQYIVPAIVGSFALAWACDHYIADRKIFGGTTPGTVSNEWWEETEKKFQAWPRIAGPPVVMNPISRQNFIVKSRSES